MKMNIFLCFYSTCCYAHTAFKQYTHQSKKNAKSLIDCIALRCFVPVLTIVECIRLPYMSQEAVVILTGLKVMTDVGVVNDVILVNPDDVINEVTPSVNLKAWIKDDRFA